MGLKYMYITNSPSVAQILDESGVDMIWVDLEKLGKAERQKNQNSVKSDHTIEDVKYVKDKLRHSSLLVRINPINSESEEEIETVIKNGADIIMLPMFKTQKEVKTFIELVRNRTEVMLLFETKESLQNIESIIDLPGIKNVHIGLNDLHLSYNKKFMFELLTDGTVERACTIFREKGLDYGVGGIAGIGQGVLPAEFILAEYKRLGASQVILSRSFCDYKNYNSLEKLKDDFKYKLELINCYERVLDHFSSRFFYENHLALKNVITELV